MEDVNVRNKRTGERKVLPRKVAENLKHVWVIEGDAPEPEMVKKKEELKSPADLVVTEFEKPVLVTDGKVEEIQTIKSPETADLTEQYTTLSGGKKPDGRWSPDKLQKKVDELKNTLTVNTDESK